MVYVGSLTTYGSSGKKGVRKPFLCKECGETDPKCFYGNQRIHCKKCHSKGTHLRKIKLKQQGVEYLGGKCMHCGYDKYIGALQFHHRDPREKDHDKFNTWKNFETLKVELDKCILLCANCHVEEHARIGRWAGR